MDATAAPATTLEDHSGSTAASASTTNIMYGCAAVAMLVLVLIVTGNTPAALLFLASVAGLALYPFSNSDSVPGDLESAREGGLVTRSKDTSWNRLVIANVLGIRDPSPYEQDPDCDAAVKLIGTVVNFQIEYHKVQPFIDDRIGNATVEGKLPDGVPPGITLRQYSELMHSMVMAEATAFSESYNSLRSSLNHGIDKARMLVTAIRSLRTPVPQEDLQQALGLANMAEHLKNMKGHNEILDRAQIFFYNVNSQLHTSQKVENLVKEIMDKTKELKGKRRDADSLRLTMGQCLGKLRGLQEHDTQLGEIHGNMNKFKEMLDKQLKMKQAELSEAKGRLERYTFRMWGPFVGMWQNDVTLARTQVEEYQSQIDTLLVKIKSSDTELSAKEWLEMKKEVKEQLGVAEQEYGAALDAWTAGEKEYKNILAEVQRKKRELDKTVTGTGQTSPQALIATYTALANFADTVHVSSRKGQTMKEAFWDEVGTYSMLAKVLVEAADWTSQSAALGDIEVAVSRTKLPLLQMVKNTKTALELTVDRRCLGLVPPPPESEMAPAIEDSRRSVEDVD